MITSIEGKIDNTSVVFTKNDTGQWSCTVPFDTDGYYTVELYAIDDAGNRTYYANALFIVNLQEMKLQIKILKYSLDVTCNDFQLNYRINKFDIQAHLCNKFTVKYSC